MSQVAGAGTCVTTAVVKLNPLILIARWEKAVGREGLGLGDMAFRLLYVIVSEFMDSASLLARVSVEQLARRLRWSERKVQRGLKEILAHRMTPLVRSLTRRGFPVYELSPMVRGGSTGAVPRGDIPVTPCGPQGVPASAARGASSVVAFKGRILPTKPSNVVIEEREKPPAGPSLSPPEPVNPGDRPAAERLLSLWAELMGRSAAVMTADRLLLLLPWLECYSEQELADAIRGASLDPWVMGTSARSERRNDELRQILRDADVIERHAAGGRKLRKAEAWQAAEEGERERVAVAARAWWDSHGGQDLVICGIQAWSATSARQAVESPGSAVERWLAERGERGESAPRGVISSLILAVEMQDRAERAQQARVAEEKRRAAEVAQGEKSEAVGKPEKGAVVMVRGVEMVREALRRAGVGV